VGLYFCGFPFEIWVQAVRLVVDSWFPTLTLAYMSDIDIRRLALENLAVD
jgi:hypothetical protein